MNFVYTTANIGKRFEIKQNIDFDQILAKKKHLFLIFEPDSCLQSFNFERINKT